MPLVLLFQVVTLLIVGQVVAGALSHAIGEVTPWLGLPFTLLWLWLILRLAVVVSEEGRQRGASWRVPALVILLWQLPTLITLPFWAPPWVSVWLHGAWTPVTGALAYIWPSMVLTPLWPFLMVEVALFAWVIAQPAPRAKAVTPAVPRAVLAAQAQQAAAHMPSEEVVSEGSSSEPNREWVAARRLKDVRGKRSTLPKGE